MPTVNSLDPTVNSLDPTINTLVPTVNSLDPTVNSLDPTVNSLDPTVNLLILRRRREAYRVAAENKKIAKALTEVAKRDDLVRVQLFKC